MKPQKLESSACVLRIHGTAAAFPDKVVANSFFGNSEQTKHSRMFGGTHLRRHLERGQTVVDLFERATQSLVSDYQLELASIDGILTNVSLPDLPFTGSGALFAKRLKIHPKRVLDFHNGGCVSFVLLLSEARNWIRLGLAKNILIAVGQTAAGRIFSHEEVRKKPQSAVPGDGAAVVWVSSEPGRGSIVLGSTVERCHPEFSEDMGIRFDDGHYYWEPSQHPGYIDFPENKVATIIMRGNRLVPEVVRAVLQTEGLSPSAVDLLITNQPNPVFIRNWRESIELPPEKHIHTFEEYANLFQAGIPVNLDRAIRSGRVQSGTNLLLGGFSHAGDYSAACVLRCL